MAKTISLPGTNLHLNGAGTNSNGLRVVKVSYVNSTAFSIQLTGNLPKTKAILGSSKTITEIDKKVSKAELSTIGKEVASYIKNYGSDTQKKKLKVY